MNDKSTKERLFSAPDWPIVDQLGELQWPEIDHWDCKENVKLSKVVNGNKVVLLRSHPYSLDLAALERIVNVCRKYNVSVWVSGKSVYHKHAMQIEFVDIEPPKVVK